MLQILSNARQDDRARAIRRTVAWRRACLAAGGADPAAAGFDIPITDFNEAMEGAALWGAMKAVWPFVGVDRFAHAQSLTGRFPITWVNDGGLGFAAAGVTSDGIGYGNTGLAPAAAGLANKNAGMTMKLGTLANRVDCSVEPASAGYGYIAALVLTGPTRAICRVGVDSTTDDDLRFTTPDAATGVITGVRDATSMRLYIDGQIRDTEPDANLVDTPFGGTQPLYLLARNLNGAATTISAAGNVLQFTAVHEALSDSAAADFHAAIDTLNTSLGR